MTVNTTKYAVNTPQMIHETIDNETVVIDTETGVYFSITGSGYLLMQMLDQGADVESLTDRLATVFEMESTALRHQVAEFVAQLLAEKLIVPVAAADNDTPLPEIQRAAHEPFAPPVLEKFTDMHELLLMDPIHEVTESGWPHRASGTAQ